MRTGMRDSGASGMGAQASGAALNGRRALEGEVITLRRQVLMRPHVHGPDRNGPYRKNLQKIKAGDIKTISDFCVHYLKHFLTVFIQEGKVMALGAIRDILKTRFAGAVVGAAALTAAASFAPDAHAQSDQTASAPTGHPVTLKIGPEVTERRVTGFRNMVSDNCAVTVTNADRTTNILFPTFMIAQVGDRETSRIDQLENDVAAALANRLCDPSHDDYIGPG